jgi:uncharacterized DUF497 family protein
LLGGQSDDRRYGFARVLLRIAGRRRWVAPRVKAMPAAISADLLALVHAQLYFICIYNLIRPISARYMHAKEIRAYEKAIAGIEE